jgi:minor histocompatibility antigen H13
VKTIGKLEDGVVDMTKDDKKKDEEKEKEKKEEEEKKKKEEEEKKAGQTGRKGHQVFSISLEAPSEEA